MLTTRLLLASIVLCALLSCNPTSGDKRSITDPLAIIDSVALLSVTINTAAAERDLAIHPDGNLIAFTRGNSRSTFSSIVLLEKSQEGWQAPILAPFSGQYRDLEPFFHPNGKQLFFVSNRPKSGGTEPDDYDIWYVNQTDSGWSEPVNIGAPINTDADEFYPSVAANGNMYFTAQYPGNYGSEDIYWSRWTDTGYSQPQFLDSTVNTKTYEFNAFISPEEDLLIFSSYGRPDGLGGGDLYVSKKNPDGSWKQANPLPEPINSSSLDYCPFYNPEFGFFFTSDRPRINYYQKPLRSIAVLDSLNNAPLNGLGNIYGVSKAGWKHLNNSDKP